MSCNHNRHSLVSFIITDTCSVPGIMGGTVPSRRHWAKQDEQDAVPTIEGLTPSRDTDMETGLMQ